MKLMGSLTTILHSIIRLIALIETLTKTLYYCSQRCSFNYISLTTLGEETSDYKQTVKLSGFKNLTHSIYLMHV